MYGIVSWVNAAIAVAMYAATVACYRLFFHPLSRVPGPWLAAATRYYEGYWDVVRNGQYTFRIAEMHRRLPGPVVRISPHELHINDPAFFNTLYRQDAHYDKNSWATDAFAAPGATIFTAPHHSHRARRQPLAPFFSKAKVGQKIDLIQHHLVKLNERLGAYAKADTTFDLGAAITAFARDVATDFILGKSYDTLDCEDFDVSMIAASKGSGAVWQLSKFVRWVAPTLQAIPIPWILNSPASEDVKTFFRYLQLTQEDTRILMERAAARVDVDDARTVVHEIMDSKLPASEKAFKRVFTDISTIAGAGFESTASVLRLITFYLWSHDGMLQTLRAELTAAGVKSEQPLSFKQLEQMPYLTATLMEGLRLSPAIATRMARIAPPKGLLYDRYHIPAGTPVGMTLILMHQDEILFPQPRRFWPERWLDDTGAVRRMDSGYAPFSKGTRNCLGMHLAWAELYIFVANLVQHFDFQFQGARAKDFECTSDQFAIGTNGKGVLKANVRSATE